MDVPSLKERSLDMTQSWKCTEISLIKKNLQTFCHLWISRHWPQGPHVHKAGLLVWLEEDNPKFQCWCCWTSARSWPPLWWHPWAFEHTRWCSPLSAARSKRILNSNRWEMYSAKLMTAQINRLIIVGLRSIIRIILHNQGFFWVRISTRF